MPAAVRPSVAAIEKLNQITFAFMATSALNAVARLEIADVLSDRPLSIDELAKRTTTNKDALCRVLRLLCSVGIFEEVSDGKFANNEVSDLIRKDVEGSQRDSVLFVGDPFHFKAYADMVPTIRDGRTAAHHVWGKGCFEFFEDDKDEQVRFNNAMTNMSRGAIAQVLDAYDFTGIEKLVDVAGGHGALLTGILNKYPKMRGVLFDLEHVTPGAVDSIKKMQLSDRCEVVSGDFFKSVPSGDAIIMKHIIHDWDDERALAILKNCHHALAKTGARKLLLAEMILSGMNEPHPSKFLDIEMLVLPGGRERTEAEYADLFAKAGFKLQRVVRTQSPICIIEAVPA
jgi:hypothetical protein